MVVGRSVEVGVDEAVGREGGWSGGNVDTVGQSWNLRNMGRHDVTIVTFRDGLGVSDGWWEQLN